MSEQLARMPKALNYMEHSVDFGNILPIPMNQSLISIHFMVTKSEPSIKSKKMDDDQKSVTVEVAMDNELQHACSITMSRERLIELKQNIDDFLAQNKA